MSGSTRAYTPGLVSLTKTQRASTYSSIKTPFASQKTISAFNALATISKRSSSIVSKISPVSFSMSSLDATSPRQISQRNFSTAGPDVSATSTTAVCPLSTSKKPLEPPMFDSSKSPTRKPDGGVISQEQPGISTRNRLKPVPAAVNEFKHLPFFSQYPLDRKVDWRRNSEALKVALETPQARLILTCRSEMLVAPYLSPLVGKKRVPKGDTGNFFYPEEGAESNHGLLQPLYLRPAALFNELVVDESSPLIFLGVDRSGAPYFAAEISETARKIHDTIVKERLAATAGVAAGTVDGSTAPGVDQQATTASSLSSSGEQMTLETAAKLAFPVGAEWKAARNAGSRMPPWDGALAAATSSLMIWHRDNTFCGVNGEKFQPSSGGYVRVAHERMSPVHNPDPASIPNSETGSSASPVAGAAAPVAPTKKPRRYVEYPRIDPAVIMLVTYGDYALLGRKKEWPPGRYSTLAGFLEVGEALEMAVARETMEESGIDVDLESVAYFSSQPWPFPRSLMIGFTARAKALEGGAAGVKERFRKFAATSPAIHPLQWNNSNHAIGNHGNEDNNHNGNKSSSISTITAARTTVASGDALTTLPFDASASNAWWPISAAGRRAVATLKISDEEVEATLLPSLLLPPPVPCPDEMQDVRWFHVGTVGATLLKHAVPSSSSAESVDSSEDQRSSSLEKNANSSTTTTEATTPPMSSLAAATMAIGQRPLVAEPAFHVPGQYALSHNLIFFWLAQHGLCAPGSRGSGLQHGFGSSAAAHTARGAMAPPSPPSTSSTSSSSSSSSSAAAAAAAAASAASASVVVPTAPASAPASNSHPSSSAVSSLPPSAQVTITPATAVMPSFPFPAAALGSIGVSDATWLWRTGFPQVCLDTSGEYKYILMRVSSSEKAGVASDSAVHRRCTSLAVWGARSCSYHSDILAAARTLAASLNLEVEPLGGGFVRHHQLLAATDDAETARDKEEESENDKATVADVSSSLSSPRRTARREGTLELYGESSGFGAAPHELSAAILRKWNPQLDLVPADSLNGDKQDPARPGSNSNPVSPPEMAALHEDGSVVLKYWDTPW